MTHPTPDKLDELERLLEASGWAKDWRFNIVPPGKPAHELACAAVRALPALIAAARREQRLREALEPFANYRGSDEYLKSAPDEGLCAATSFTAGDFRRARATLADSGCGEVR